jgi:hypothetical protein
MCQALPATARARKSTAAHSTRRKARIACDLRNNQKQDTAPIRNSHHTSHITQHAASAVGSPPAPRGPPSPSSKSEIGVPHFAGPISISRSRSWPLAGLAVGRWPLAVGREGTHACALVAQLLAFGYAESKLLPDANIRLQACLISNNQGPRTKDNDQGGRALCLASCSATGWSTVLKQGSLPSL